MTLKDTTIDERIQSVKGLSPDEKQTLINVSEKSWFRSYARKSKAQLDKILRKVKKGIKHGQYTYTSASIESEPQGMVLPKVKKGKGSKKSKKPSKDYQTVAGSTKKSKSKKQRKEREQKKQVKEYKGYSKYEIHEGVKSKRAKEYRRKHNIHRPELGDDN